MKPPRSALPKPRYVLREPLKGGVAYFFNVPMWARAAGCPISNEPLGVDYAKAVERAETVLLPAFDSWRTGGKSDHVAPPTKTVFGTLDWIFAEYCADRRYTKLSVRQRRNHKTGFRLVGGHALKDGRKLGSVRVAAIDTAVVDALYEKLLVVKETDADGNTIERERRTTVNNAMKSCRRPWKIASRRNPGKVPHINPFSAMGLVSSDRVTPTSTFTELQTFRAKAIELGLPSLATAALIGWESRTDSAEAMVARQSILPRLHLVRGRARRRRQERVATRPIHLGGDRPASVRAAHLPPLPRLIDQPRR